MRCERSDAQTSGLSFYVYDFTLFFKIVQAKQLIGSRSIEISVDGGINDKTGNAAANSGADILVAGHYIFKSYDPAVAIQTLKGF